MSGIERIDGNFKVNKGYDSYSTDVNKSEDDFKKKLKEMSVHVAYAQGLVPGSSGSVWGWGSKAGDVQGSENSTNAIQA